MNGLLSLVPKNERPRRLGFFGLTEHGLTLLADCCKSERYALTPCHGSHVFVVVCLLKASGLQLGLLPETILFDRSPTQTLVSPRQECESDD